MFSVVRERQTELEIYQLPTPSAASPMHSRQLSVSHRAIYPGAICKITACVSAPPPSDTRGSDEVRIGILATCWDEAYPRRYTFATSIQRFDIIIRSSGNAHFLQSPFPTLIPIKPQATNIFATHCPTMCLALTQTQTYNGQILMTYHIRPSTYKAANTIVPNHLTLPGMQEGMTLVAFDGFRGRICFNVEGAKQPRIVVWDMV
jgi:hypothetical protein